MIVLFGPAIAFSFAVITASTSTKGASVVKLASSAIEAIVVSLTSTSAAAIVATLLIPLPASLVFTVFFPPVASPLETKVVAASILIGHMALHAAASHVATSEAIVVKSLPVLLFILPSEVSLAIHTVPLLETSAASITSVIAIVPTLSLTVAKVTSPVEPSIAADSTVT